MILENGNLQESFNIFTPTHGFQIPLLSKLPSTEASISCTTQRAPVSIELYNEGVIYFIKKLHTEKSILNRKKQFNYDAFLILLVVYGKIKNLSGKGNVKEFLNRFTNVIVTELCYCRTCSTETLKAGLEIKSKIWTWTHDLMQDCKLQKTVLYYHILL